MARIAIVTGGSRGIGEAISLKLKEQGVTVVANYGGNDEKAREFTDRTGIAARKWDVGDHQACIDHCAAIAAEFGPIDIVVNNAGILRDVIFHKMSFEDWDSVIKVHLYGSFNVSRAAAEHFRKQESGTFVHMTSTSGLVGNPGQANYSAAKMGIVGLSKSLALDMARFNVRSNCISPFAWSRMVGSIPNTPDQEQRLNTLRMLTPDKVANVAVFLAADDAKEVNGQIFAVRGNEVFLMSQPRPLRSVHRSEGWTPETLRDHLLPTLRPSFVNLDMSRDVFSWMPV